MEEPPTPEGLLCGRGGLPMFSALGLGTEQGQLWGTGRPGDRRGYLTGQVSLPGDLTEPLRPGSTAAEALRAGSSKHFSSFRDLRLTGRNQTPRPTNTQIQCSVQRRAQWGGLGWLSPTEGETGLEKDSHRVVLTQEF